MAEETTQPAGEDPEQLQKIYATIEGAPVLLPIPRGEKGPAFAGWQKITWEQSRAVAKRVQEFRNAKPGEKLATGKDRVPAGPPRVYPELLAERSRQGNVGVLLGAPSTLEADDGKEFHLCCIDIDDAEAVEPFIAANPKLAFSLRIVGARGCKIFLWIEGIYQERKVPLFYLGEDGKPVSAKNKDKAKQWGDWLATGAQAVVHGLHPSGVNYAAVVKKPPARLTFSEINWPTSIHRPWGGEAAADSSDGSSPPPPPEPTEDQKKVKEFAELVSQYGKPWTISKKGKMTLNQTFFAAFYAKKHRVVYSPEEQRFFRYKGDECGLWTEQTSSNIAWELAADMKQISDETTEDALINLRTTQFENAVLAKLKGAVEKWEAFKRARSPKTRRARALIHLRNGMLDLDESPPLLHPFAAEFMSRAQIDVEMKEEADCPRFKKELLETAIPDKDDQVLLQKFFGQYLLGVNLSQMFLMLTSPQGGNGKSTIVNVFIELIGERNVGQLRTGHLHERFEIFRMLGKTLLTGVDVPGDFLMSEGAYVIKGLVGGDLLDAEPKNGNQTFQVRGELNMIMTCNSRLKVKLEGDGDAWRRRMGIIVVKGVPPTTPDPSFVQKLVASEASGILNWGVEGVVMLLDDLAKFGRLQLTAEQKQRTASLLAESDSVKDFARNGVRRCANNKVTSEQISGAYVAYCERRGWSPMSTSVVEKQMPDALLELHGATKANDIKQNESDKAKRGYRGIEIVTEIKEDAPDGLL